MDELARQPLSASAIEAPSVDSQEAELAGIVRVLEDSLERIEALGLTLVAALLDHAVTEARRELSD
jgi:hypothetical protein